MSSRRQVFHLEFVVTIGAVVKNPPAKARDVRDTGSIPGSGRSPRGGNGKPIQYSWWDNPMNRRAWWATVVGSLRIGHN